VTNTQADVLLYIQTHCQGRDKAQKVPDIALALQVKPTAVRLAVQELRTRWGMPVCSTFRQPAGLYWATTQDEIAATLDELRARRDSLSRMITTIERRNPQQVRHNRRPRIVPRPEPRREESLQLFPAGAAGA
jgi:hypothetical protein